MSKYSKDKERMDRITEIIAERRSIKEWVVLYWMAVAIGHILEWMVKHEHNTVADGSGNRTTDNVKGE